MQTIKLGKLAQNIIDYRGKSVPKSDSGVPLITARNIRQGFIDFKEKEFISSESFVDWASKGFPAAGDVLITTEAPLGMVALFPEGKYAIGQRVICIQPNHQLVDPKYLMYQLLSESGQRKLYKLSSGSTALGIKQSELKKIEVLLLPLEEQKKIAQILSTWDEAIEAVKELIEKEKYLFRSLLHKSVGVKKEPNYKVGEIAKVKHGKPQHEVENHSGKYPILATGGVIGYADKYLTDKPSVLIGRKGTIDKPGYIDKPFWHVDTLFRLEASNKLIPKWLYYYFLSINWQSYNQGAVLPSLTGSTIESIKLFLPDTEKQSRDVELLDNVEGNIALLKQKRELLLKQKKGLMQRLLTGKVRVS